MAEIGALLKIPKGYIPEEELFLQLAIPNKNFGRYSKKLGGMDYQKTVYFLREDSDYHYIPRNFPVERYGVELEDCTEAGKFADIIFTKKLRNYQEEFFAKNDLFQHPDRIINAGCGSGKTVMSLWVICQLKRKTLVIVPTNYLAEQYKDRADFFTDAKTNIALSTKKIDSDCDIMIMTYALFLSRDFSADFLAEFGHLVVDEGHRIGADTYEAVVPKMNTSFRTLITATFRREDGAEKILLFHFGKVFKMKNVNPLVGVTIANTGIELAGFGNTKKLKEWELSKIKSLLDSMDIAYQLLEEYLVIYGRVSAKAKRQIEFELSGSMSRAKRFIDNCLNPDSFATLDSALALIPERNELIIALTAKKVREGKKILLLSKRKNQLFFLKEELEKQGINVKLMVGKANKVGDTNFDEGTYDVIVAIDKLAKEGADLPDLDVLILCHLFGDPEQALGRVARIKDGKEPEAYFLLDDHSMCRGLLRKAKKIIPNNGFIANTIDL